MQAPTMPSGTHSVPSSYGPYFMPFPSQSIGGLANPANMGLMPDYSGLPAQVLPGPGGQGYLTTINKPKNDKLEVFC